MSGVSLVTLKRNLGAVIHSLLYGRYFEFSIPLSLEICVERIGYMERHNIFYPQYMQVVFIDEKTYIFRLDKEVHIGRFLYVQAIGDLEWQDDEMTLVKGEARFSDLTLYLILPGSLLLFLFSFFFPLDLAFFAWIATIVVWLVCVSERNALPQEIYSVLTQA